MTPHRIAILGRPNVGKSTLFNRICGRRRALVGNEPGMTRDRIYAPGEWCGKTFEVIDTGGILPDEKNMMASEIYNQARVAMEESSQLVLVVDGRKGAMPLDEELAGLLRREGKPLSLAVNKIDENSTAPLAADFYRLGIPHLFAISAEHGSGVDDLLDHVTRNFPRDQEGVEVRDEVIQIAIIGHPNVGKSTLLNRLTGRERSIVTPVAGTTRDAVDAEIERDGHRFRLVDTAGIRRKGKTRLMAEKLSVIQARKHLERSDVALLLLDAAEGVTALDTHIGGYAHESGRSVILVVNKWDAVKKDTRSTLEFTRTVREQMKYLNYAPVVFISALTGQRTSKLFASVAEVAAARRQRISTAELNRFVETLDLERAASPAGKPLRLYYLTQAGTSPPIFVAFTNRPLYFSVGRYIENRLREKFGFNGTPVIIKSRLKK
ncbi:MAG: ribosome biogenesis GTPase Der [Terriglobia bacterium]